MRLFAFCAGLLLLSAPLAGAADQFLAYNLWIHEGNSGNCINYKTGRILPAGSRIDDIRIVRPKPNPPPSYLGGTFSPYIALTSAGQRYVINYDADYHRGESIDSCAADLTTTTPPAELLAGIAPAIRDAITRGEVVPGMNKREVVLSYGPPPEEKTPDLDRNLWVYWLNKTRRKFVCFDADDLVVDCRQESGGE